MRLRIFLSCLPGLEPLLEAEVRDVLAPALEGEPRVEPGGVEVEGSAELAHLACLGLGLATHALARVASFRARSLDELEAHVARLPWSGWIARGVPFDVTAGVREPRALRHTGAIADRIASGIGARLGSAREDGGVPVRARVVADRVTLSIDLAGEPLPRRGYRLEPGRAPLREDLARAAVILSGWDRRRPLVDPMCGSGTIAIEAALLASRAAPGATRRFALERCAFFDAGSHASALAKLQARRSEPALVVASDADPRQVEVARRNIERAGVAVQLERRALSEAEVPEDAGALVTNPPWGERIGEREGLKKLHRALGRLFTGRFPENAAFALVTADARLARTLGFPWSAPSPPTPAGRRRVCSCAPSPDGARRPGMAFRSESPAEPPSPDGALTESLVFPP